MSTNSNALAAFDPTLAALGMAQDEPIRPSTINLVQPIEADDESGLIAGRFRDAQSNMQFPAMDLAVIQIAPGRVCYPPDSERGAKPLCRSRDGIMPVINDNLIRQDDGRGCALCPKSQWKKIAGKSIKPQCREVMNLLLVDIETEFIYRYNVKGTSLAPVKDLQQMIAKSVRYAAVKGVAIPYWGLVYRMGSLRIKNTKGTFYNPKFTPIGNLMDAEKYPDGLEKMHRIGKMAEYFIRGQGRGAATEAEDGGDAVDNVMNGTYEPEAEQQYEAA